MEFNILHISASWSGNPKWNTFNTYKILSNLHGRGRWYTRHENEHVYRDADHFDGARLKKRIVNL